MTDKERLVGLIKEAFNLCHGTKCFLCQYNNKDDYDCDDKLLADLLIANGVVVQKQGEMKGSDYQKAAMPFIPDISKQEMKHHALFGMASEVGELHGLHQKLYQGHELNETHAKKELGDILWFLAEYCTAMDWELDEIMALNIEKLTVRYPDGFDPEKSLHRAAGDI